jgi:hypothetical protein
MKCLRCNSLLEDGHTGLCPDCKTKPVLWCLTHEPVPKQLKELLSPVEKLKDVNPELFSELANCPGDKRKLKRLVFELFETIEKLGFKVVVLPIGSPAFQVCFGMCYITDKACDSFEILFAHSKRVSEDIPQPDGSIKKVSVFRHVEFFGI